MLELALEPLTTVKLYGHLGKKFGRVHKFAVRTAKEAADALSANFPKFRSYMTEHSSPGFHVLVGGHDIGESELRMTFTPGKTVKIIPAVLGAKAGALQTILGIVLIVVGVIWEQPWMIKIGAALVLGGVATMLSQSARHDLSKKDDERKNKPSFVYDGPQQTTSQGWPVPVCYGTMEIGSAVVSMGIHAEDYYGQGENEPSTGFRIVQPYLSTHKMLRLGGPDTVSIADTIVLASYLNTPTVTITQQSSGDHFTLSGPAGAQVLGATALPAGVYSVTLHATDGTNVTDKNLAYYVMLDEDGDRDTNPRLRD